VRTHRQRDVAAKEKLKAENEKLEASLVLTRSTLAAVRQQNEQQNHLVASLRQVGATQRSSVQGSLHILPALFHV
jgi:hypothetical protein